MKDFTNSSKILYRYSKNESDGDIEHFNNADNKGFFEFENNFSSFIDTFLTHSNKTKFHDTLYLSNVVSLKNIYNNKKKYNNNQKNDEEITSHINIINDYINEVKSTVAIFDELKEMQKSLESLNKVLESLNSDNEYSYKYSEKRAKVINDKISAQQEEIKTLKKTLKSTIDKLPNVKESFNKVKDLLQHMDDNAEPRFKVNLATKFIKNQERKDDLMGAIQSKIVSFLQDKISEDDIVDRYVFTKGQKNEEVIIFKDGSIAALKRGVYVTPEMKYGAYKELSEEISRDVASFLLRKKPAYVQPFIKKMAAENYNVNGMYIAINSFIKNEQILKNYQFDVLGELDKSKNLEYFDDAVDKVRRKHEQNLLAASIFTGRYKELYDKKATEHIKTLYELKVTKDDLQDNIGKKMAGFKTSAEVNEALKKYVNSLQEFEADATINKAAKFDTNVALHTEDMVILKINNYEASKALGSGSWCISRHESHFDSYAGSKDKLQFFVFDYTKESNDKLSMIGITLNTDGTHSAAHIKNDDPLYASDKKFLALQKTIIKENMHLFELSDSMKKKMKETDEEAPSNKKNKIKNAL